jgi:N,N'-diacetyllegionaminate synthase
MTTQFQELPLANSKLVNKKGELFSEKNIAVKRPGNGISPMKWESVLGEIAKRDFLADELIEL